MLEHWLILGGCAVGLVLLFSWGQVARLLRFGRPVRQKSAGGQSALGGWMSGLPVWDAIDRELGRRTMFYRVLFWAIALVVVIAAVSIFIHSNGGQCDPSLSDKAYAACQDDHQRERPY